VEDGIGPVRGRSIFHGYTECVQSVKPFVSRRNAGCRAWIAFSNPEMSLKGESDSNAE